jgi:ankyrin repeat protein
MIIKKMLNNNRTALLMWLLFVMIIYLIPTVILADYIPNINKKFRSAVYNNNVSLAKEMLLRGADPNDKNGYALLMSVVEKDDNRTEMLSLLIEYGIDLKSSSKYSKTTPLHKAKSPEIAKILLDAGIDVNASSSSGVTPLHYARNPEVVKILLDAGADVNASSESGITPLHNAITLEVVRVLLNAGADVNASSDAGITPLHNVGNPGVADALLQAGADVNASSNAGITPLHNAINPTFKPEVIKILLDAGADINASSKSGLTPLLSLLTLNGYTSKDKQRQYLNYIKYFLETGADPNVATKMGAPLHVVSRKYRGDVEIIKLLLQYGANANAVHNFYSSQMRMRSATPLMFAVFDLQLDKAEILLKNNADINLVVNGCDVFCALKERRAYLNSDFKNYEEKLQDLNRMEKLLLSYDTSIIRKTEINISKVFEYYKINNSKISLFVTYLISSLLYVLLLSRLMNFNIILGIILSFLIAPFMVYCTIESARIMSSGMDLAFAAGVGVAIFSISLFVGILVGVVAIPVTITLINRLKVLSVVEKLVQYGEIDKLEKRNVFNNTTIFLITFISIYLFYLLLEDTFIKTKIDYMVNIPMPVNVIYLSLAPLFIVIAWMRGSHFEKSYLAILPMMATVPFFPISLLIIFTTIIGTIWLPYRHIKSPKRIIKKHKNF